MLSVGGLLVLAAALLALNGCELGYYAHLARGQADIVLHCRPLEELAADPSLSPETAARLELVCQIREYAGDVIGLDTSRNYTCFYDTGERPVCWNVSACPPDRFEAYEWRFPLVGAVPYKGFFDLDRARRERERLRAQGYDTILRPVSAYSTLGYFSDPVLSGMLRYPEDALADLLIHELTHSTVYLKGHTDFNESLATYVGRQGSLDFLAAQYGPGGDALEAARSRRRDSALFRELVEGLVDSLDSLYTTGLPRNEILEERGGIFEAAKARYRSRRDEFSAPDRYDGFLDWEVNNASLLSYRRYNRDLELFERLWALHDRDLKRTVRAVAGCEGRPDPWQCLSDLAAGARARVEQCPADAGAWR